MDIKIRINNKWILPNNYQIEAFIKFKNNENHFQGEREHNFNYNGINYSIKRLGDQYYGGIHIINNDINIPIADWNDVKVFLLDNVVNWYDARNYQKWCYFNFIYNNDIKRSYKSKDTLGFNDHIEIPIDYLEPYIIFSISRNDNGTIYYEKNDISRTKIRISDNNQARLGYLGYYHRMTDFSPMDFMVIDSVSSSSKLKLPNNILIKKTNNEELMCIICNDNEQNIRFLNCKHTNVCSECFKQLTKSNECPICKQPISNIEIFNIV